MSAFRGLERGRHDAADPTRTGAHVAFCSADPLNDDWRARRSIIRSLDEVEQPFLPEGSSDDLLDLAHTARDV